MQGTPYAYFPSQSCDISEHFGEHNLIINLTFCACPSLAPFLPCLSNLVWLRAPGGDWAGAVYSADGCPGDCAST